MCLNCIWVLSNDKKTEDVLKTVYLKGCIAVCKILKISKCQL